MLKGQWRKNFIEKRGNKCEKCGITEWLGQAIKLEIHHLDGNNQNDVETNLQVLCPNCHSFTENYCRTITKNNLSDNELLIFLKEAPTIRQALLQAGLSTAGTNYTRARKLAIDNGLEHLIIKKEATKKYSTCIDCGCLITTNAIRCLKCNAIHSRLTKRPSREDLKQLIRTTSFIHIGEIYNVSDNAIRKWCDFYGLPRKKKEIKTYSDEEWALL